MKLVATGKSDLSFLERIPDSVALKAGRLPDHAQRDVYERVIGKEKPGEPVPGGIFERARDLIMAFDIFDPATVRAVTARAPVKEGDTIGLEVPFLPGLSWLFGCRVATTFSDVRDSRVRAGFSYHTLQGHPVLGEESFSVEKDFKTGAVKVALRSWSLPGHWLTVLGQPFLRMAQKNASKGALDYLEKKIAR